MNNSVRVCQPGIVSHNGSWFCWKIDNQNTWHQCDLIVGFVGKLNLTNTNILPCQNEQWGGPHISKIVKQINVCKENKSHCKCLSHSVIFVTSTIFHISANIKIDSVCLWTAFNHIWVCQVIFQNHCTMLVQLGGACQSVQIHCCFQMWKCKHSFNESLMKGTSS